VKLRSHDALMRRPPDHGCPGKAARPKVLDIAAVTAF
jgi:hypothetical protein